MTKAFEANGFRFYIRNPPREHGPPHVHVKKADAEVAINLSPGDGDDLVREVYRMRDADVVKAVRLGDEYRPSPECLEADPWLDVIFQTAIFSLKFPRRDFGQRKRAPRACAQHRPGMMSTRVE